MYECKDGKQEIVQQPADLTTLSANLAMAAANFVDKQAGQSFERVFTEGCDIMIVSIKRLLFIQRFCTINITTIFNDINIWC